MGIATGLVCPVNQTMESTYEVTLFGCGKMARAYAPVLDALHCPFLAVGNSTVGVESFFADTGASARSGGWEKWLRESVSASKMAIVALPLPELAPASIALMRAGTRRILLEKPGGLDAGAIRDVAKVAEETKSDVRIGYNRRYYAATQTAREMLANDGGPLSFHFEFTEMPDRVLTHIKDAATLQNWFLANSSHVVDLAFHLGGEPIQLTGQVAGGLPWHPSGSRFVGHGESVSGALFSYHANWDCPGSWRLEVATRERKLVFRPMEKLSVQDRGAFREEPVAVDYSLDEKFKPGVYRQVEAFLRDSSSLRRIPTVQEHAARLPSLLAPLRGALV